MDAQKTSYHVVVDTADHDDDQELPQRTFQIERPDRLTPEWSVEPKVVFKLLAPVVATQPPTIRGTAAEFFEPCLPGEAPELLYPSPCTATPILLPPWLEAHQLPPTEALNCPKPRAPSPEYVRPPRRLSTVSPSPPRRYKPAPPPPRRAASKIKFDCVCSTTGRNGVLLCKSG